MAGANIQAVKDWIKTNKTSKEYFDDFLEEANENLLSVTQDYCSSNLINQDIIDHIEDNNLSIFQEYMQANFFSKTQLDNMFNVFIEENKYSKEKFLDFKSFICGFRHNNYIYTGIKRTNIVPIMPIVNSINSVFDIVDSDTTLFGNPFSDSTKNWILSIRVFLFDPVATTARAVCGDNNNNNGNVSYKCPYFYVSTSAIGIRFSSAGGSVESENNVFRYPKEEHFLNNWIRLELEWIPETSTFISRIFDTYDQILYSQQKDNINYTLNSTSSVAFGFGGNSKRADRYGDNIIYDLGNTYWAINGIITWGYDSRGHNGRYFNGE